MPGGTLIALAANEIVMTGPIPLEVYETVRNADLVIFFVLVSNAAIVVYLWRRREVFGD